MRKYDTKKHNSWEKSGIKPKNIPQDKFIDICKNSESMAHAASTLGLHFNSFKKYALLYDCYEPNQSGLNIKKEQPETDILNIKTRAGIRKRIIKYNYITYECQMCKISEWNGKKLSLHLDHIDGDRWNHDLKNLRWLCPNCHSLTDSYTGKNKK
jgi:hypothetical protein